MSLPPSQMAPFPEDCALRLGNSDTPLDLTISLGKPGTIDGGELLTVDRLIRVENHGYVYRVRNDGLEDDCSELEARVFLLGGVPPKVRRHRLRCISRLSPRTLVKKTWDAVTVVVVHTKIPRAESRVTESDAVGATPGEKAPESNKEDAEQKKPSGKTSRQREAARIRQLNRRRAPQSENRSLDEPEIDATLGDTWKAILDEQKARLDEKDASSVEQGVFLNKIEALLDRPRAHLDKREASIAKREASLNNQEASLHYKDALREEPGAFPNEREALLQEQETLLRERETLLREWQAGLQERKALLQRWEALLHQRGVLLDVKEALL